VNEADLPADSPSDTGMRDPITDVVGTSDDELGAPSENDNVIFSRLIAEHAAERIGRTWVDELIPICRRVGIKYHSRTYADVSSWGPEAFDDLLQDTVVRLLAKSQVEYIVDVAQDLGHVRALLHNQVRYTLVDRRRTTLIDNLLSRASALLTEPPFVILSVSPNSWTTRLAASETASRADDVDDKTEDPAAASALMFRLRRLPRLPARGVERASPLWSRETLTKALEDICNTLGSVSLDELRNTLSASLTSAAVTEISNFDAAASDSTGGIRPDDQVEANEVLQALLEELSDEEASVLRGKFQGRSDSDISVELGMSRPTVVARRTSAATKAQNLLSGANDDVRDFVLQRFQSKVLQLDRRAEDE
jgi:hypothetical protein